LTDRDETAKPRKVPSDNRGCGEMAEWSMAVVLKTTRIGYTKTVIFSRATSLEHAQDVAGFCAIIPFFQPTLITDRSKFACNSLI
jgi:hypothetical protein